MNRRQGMRRPLALNVVLDRQAAGPCRAQTLDVSTTGMLLRVEGEAPPRGSRARLVFTLHEERGPYAYRVPVTVVRASEHGIGVAFDHSDGSSFRALLWLLSRPANRSAAVQAPAVG